MTASDRKLVELQIRQLEAKQSYLKERFAYLQARNEALLENLRSSLPKAGKKRTKLNVSFG